MWSAKEQQLFLADCFEGGIFPAILLSIFCRATYIVSNFFIPFAQVALSMLAMRSMVYVEKKTTFIRLSLYYVFVIVCISSFDCYIIILTCFYRRVSGPLSRMTRFSSYGFLGLVGDEYRCVLHVFVCLLAFLININKLFIVIFIFMYRFFAIS